MRRSRIQKGSLIISTVNPNNSFYGYFEAFLCGESGDEIKRE